MAEAADLLANSVVASTPIAGATWIMRAPTRGESYCQAYVSMASTPSLQAIQLNHEFSIGAAVTHMRLAEATAPIAALHGLWKAAIESANPAIRNMATVGGNISVGAFRAADLVLAFLSLDAHVVLDSVGGQERLPMRKYLDVLPIMNILSYKVSTKRGHGHTYRWQPIAFSSKPIFMRARRPLARLAPKAQGRYRFSTLQRVSLS